MLDPFPIAPPPFLVAASKPFSDALNLHSLPLHVHEILFAAALYIFTEKVVSPWISNLLCPDTYRKLSSRSRINWDVHVVSMVQSLLINSISLYIIWFDEERKAWRDPAQWEQRIWGYYGSGGLAQSFALGYFLWDLYACTVHVDIFGWGMLAHGVSAVAVFALGYRPIIYFSAPVFLLYELSSPFLNVHWFCDKLDLTGSTIQAVNGVFLTTTFFFCRIVWGFYSSYGVFKDVWRMVNAGQTNYSKMVPMGRMHVMTTHELLAVSRDKLGQLDAFNREQYLPLWIPVIYLASNLVLNSLNVFWFGKMIETIRTRFDPPWGTKGLEDEGKVLPEPTVKDEKSAVNSEQHVPLLDPEGAKVEEDGDVVGDGSPAKVATSKSSAAKSAASPKKGGSVRAARAKAEEAMNGPVGVVEDTKMERRVVDSDGIGVEVTGSTRQTARSRRKA